MSFTTSHPRRRPEKASSAPTTPPASHGVALLKSDTFHQSRKVDSDLCNPFVDAAFAPKRSQTCPKALEDLILETGEDRIAKILKEVEHKLAGTSLSDNNASLLSDREVFPVPSFMVANAVTVPMDTDIKPAVVDDHHHESDSGLGSSLSDSEDYGVGSRSSSKGSSASSTASYSTITKSYASPSVGREHRRFLSKHATKAINQHIVQPILKEESLKDFHPLIEDVPARIGAKFITNLRDLEKTLLFLAPRYSATPSSYLRFAETTAGYIATTVEHISERDQRLPSDRPYTNGYFLDLVEQIRKYAQIMAETREKEAKGEKLDEMDYSRDEKITIRGGLSHNGKPLEFVRQKDGQTIPITAGGDREIISSKRAHSDIDDEEIRRSMARRRKSDRPGDVMHPCAVCSKEFKRPCDLTKHEKTHSRPWKCPEPKCKYHDDGWPTEKERDRHVNDKHSAAPPMHKCNFDCSYASKRESNLKQHMEKAHGWTYVRSKSNGKKKASSTSGSNSISPPTPATPFIATPSSAFPSISTPASRFNPSPAMNSLPDFDFNSISYTPAQQSYDLRRESVTTAGTEMTYSSSHSPAQPSFFDENISPDDVGFNHNLDSGFSGHLSINFSDSNYQQPTPAMSHRSYGDVVAPFETNFAANQPVPHLSPGAQADATLFSPHMSSIHGIPVDEGFGDFGDFTLFPTGQNSGIGNDAMMFQDLGLDPVGCSISDSSMFPSMGNTNMHENIEEFLAGLGNR